MKQRAICISTLVYFSVATLYCGTWIGQFWVASLFTNSAVEGKEYRL
jgi:hypothetical protein